MAARLDRDGGVAGMPPSLDAEPDQISGPDPPQPFEDDRRVLDDKAEAERNRADQQRISDRAASDREQACPRAARRAGSDHQSHDRAGRENENA